MVLNLILNAAEAMQGRGSGKVTVATAAGVDGQSVVLSVSDNGEGIPAENLPRIFDPFFTTKADGKGWGWAWRFRTASCRRMGATSR